MTISARIFVALGAFLAGTAVLYGFTSEEEAGTVMLLLSGALALFIGVYLTRATSAEAPPDHGVSARTKEAAQVEPAQAAFLPHESVWPFWLGLAALLLGNGLALGLWALIPGAIVAFAALWGLSRQSRRRE